MWTKERIKQYYQENKEKTKIWQKEHKEHLKEYQKNYKQTHKEQINDYNKNYQIVNKEKIKDYKLNNREHLNEYARNYAKIPNNQIKVNCRHKSHKYLKKYGQKIDDYQIHHCFTYNEPYKFIYCSKQMHKLIHEYLRAHNIDADSEHYQYIKHLLDDTVIKYNID